MLQREVAPKNRQGGKKLNSFSKQADPKIAESACVESKLSKLSSLLSLYLQSGARSVRIRSALWHELIGYGVPSTYQISITGVRSINSMLKISQQKLCTRQLLHLHLSNGYSVELTWRKKIADNETALYDSLGKLHAQYCAHAMMAEMGANRTPAKQASVAKIVADQEALGFMQPDDLLHKTFSSFLSSNLSITETARSLGLHRNTVAYRLNKIKSTTGLDPAKFTEAVLLSEYYRSKRCNQ